MLDVVLLMLALGAAPATRPIDWQKWSADVFQQAKQEHKFVLLDLGTQWCHWCHVMENTTYADGQVNELIDQKYIAVRVDADSRPDLSNRYEDYGWPATIVFNADGGEIAKRRGYLDPTEMASMLKAIIADPTPGPSVMAEKQVQFVADGAMSGELRQRLLAIHGSTFDVQNGSWGRGQKFLEWDSVEWSMRAAVTGDGNERHMARQTLDAQLNLLDPAWGGVYQYSTDDDWNHPHFEKIMQMQAENLRIYSLAWSQFHEPAYLHAATAIHNYLTNFLLGPDGAFYTDQDADLIDGVHGGEYFKLSDADRRKQGIPRVDQHHYSRENGWAIQATVIYHDMTGDIASLQQAITAANWIIQNRGTSDGGFHHDQSDTGGFYLGDTLSMGQAFLELYIATADRAWLERAQRAADFVSSHFQQPGSAGLVTTDSVATGPISALPEYDENTAAARFANLLWQYTGNAADKTLARTAMNYVATPDIAKRHGIQVCGALLADYELARPALHIVIVASKSSADAAALYQLGLSLPTSDRRLEWYDPAEGALPNADVQYPDLGKPAAFVCTGTTCSPPSFTSEQFARRLHRATGAQ